MDGEVIAALIGLMFSHAALYYKLGKIEQEIKYLKRKVCKNNYGSKNKAVVQEQGLSWWNWFDAFSDNKSSGNKTVRTGRR